MFNPLAFTKFKKKTFVLLSFLFQSSFSQDPFEVEELTEINRILEIALNLK